MTPMSPGRSEGPVEVEFEVAAAAEGHSMGWGRWGYYQAVGATLVLTFRQSRSSSNEARFTPFTPWLRVELYGARLCLRTFPISNKLIAQKFGMEV